MLYVPVSLRINFVTLSGPAPWGTMKTLWASHPMGCQCLTSSPIGSAYTAGPWSSDQARSLPMLVVIQRPGWALILILQPIIRDQIMLWQNVTVIGNNDKAPRKTHNQTKWFIGENSTPEACCHMENPQQNPGARTNTEIETCNLSEWFLCHKTELCIMCPQTQASQSWSQSFLRSRLPRFVLWKLLLFESLKRPWCWDNTNIYWALRTRQTLPKLFAYVSALNPKSPMRKEIEAQKGE